MANKNIRQLNRKLRDMGLEPQLRRSNHYKVDCPDGTSVFYGSTPRGYRSYKDTIAQLKRSGVDVERGVLTAANDDVEDVKADKADNPILPFALAVRDYFSRRK